LQIKIGHAVKYGQKSKTHQKKSALKIKKHKKTNKKQAKNNINLSFCNDYYTITFL
jgi:hypothetical protein